MPTAGTATAGVTFEKVEAAVLVDYGSKNAKVLDAVDVTDILTRTIMTNTALNGAVLDGVALG
jgi:hypothetical protein